mgnify:CR=1 FL=1
MKCDTLKFLAVAVCVGGLGATRAVSATKTVYVLPHEFSTYPNVTDPITDPVIFAGDAIHWEFLSQFHSVTSCAGNAEEFDSGLIFSLPASFEHTFNNPGVFQYYCFIHGGDNGDGTGYGMSGIVTVLPVGVTCDSVDFNNDTLFPDTQDITDFISVFGGGVCAGQEPGDQPCNTDIDFNNDSLFPDVADIDSLLSVFSGGTCV